MTQYRLRHRTTGAIFPIRSYDKRLGKMIVQTSNGPLEQRITAKILAELGFICEDEDGNEVDYRRLPMRIEE